MSYSNKQYIMNLFLAANKGQDKEVIEELVDATDDYYGAATVGDDEYASFTKVTVDNILQLDIAKFNIGNIVANIATITDNLVSNTNKFLSSQFNTVESNTRLINSL